MGAPFSKKRSFLVEKNRRRPLRTQVQGFWSQKFVFYLKSALLGGEKNAGGRRAQKYRAFGYKSELFTQKALFFGEKKTPEAAATRSTGLLVTKVSFLLKQCSFLGEKNTGGRRAQKHTTFVKLMVFKKLAFVSCRF